MTVTIPVAALLLAAILGLSAAHKLIERDRLAIATARLLRLQSAVAIPITMAAAAIEIAAALAIVFPASRSIGASIAAILWSVYGAALLTARVSGNSVIDCGCDFGKRSAGIGGFAIVRAFALAAGAMALCFSSTGNGDIGIHSIFAALAFLALYFAAGEVAQISGTGRSFVR